MGAVDNSQEMSGADLSSFLPSPSLRGLQLLARPTRPIPLDPNGVDVYGEVPYMRSAYGLTANGRAENGTQEALYALVNNQDGVSRTKPVLSGNRHNSSRLPSRTLAVVHTHPQMANPAPSNEDIEQAKMSKIPDYVYSNRNGQQAVQVANPNGKTFQYNVSNWNTEQPSGLNKLKSLTPQ
jgi:cytochrome c biogenesis protein ResB